MKAKEYSSCFLPESCSRYAGISCISCIEQEPILVFAQSFGFGSVQPLNLEDFVNFTSFRSVAKAEKSSITEGEESGMLLEYFHIGKLDKFLIINVKSQELYFGPLLAMI